MRRRLVALAATTTIMVALAFLIPLAVLVRTLARDRALSAAELEAQSLAPVLALTRDTTALEAAVRATTPGASGRLTITLPDGTVVGGSADGEGLGTDGNDTEDPREQENLALAREGRAFSAPTRGGIQVLVPVALEIGATAVVRVLVPDSTLKRGVAAAWGVEAALGITLVASAVFVADRLARTIVRPVDALADAAGRLGEGDLSVRIHPEGPPEVKQVALAFNRLGDRVGELLEAERELVADLSHRLRTPLTVLRLDAEGLDNPEEARRLADDVDELERAVTGMIRQARRPVGGGHRGHRDRRRQGGRGPSGLLGPPGRGPGAGLRVRRRRRRRARPPGGVDHGGGVDRRARGGRRCPARQRVRPHPGGHRLPGGGPGPAGRVDLPRRRGRRRRPLPRLRRPGRERVRRHRPRPRHRPPDRRRRRRRTSASAVPPPAEPGSPWSSPPPGRRRNARPAESRAPDNRAVRAKWHEGRSSRYGR